MKTRSEQIKIFTEESQNKQLPNYPAPMTDNQVDFLVKMICEELLELLYTVYDNPRQSLLDIVNNKVKDPIMEKPSTEDEVIAEQVDALIDIDYYNGNAACKVGMNMDDVFNLVHQANMNKRFTDGKFHTEDGKVIKPKGWVAPNIVDVVKKWKENGTW